MLVVICWPSKILLMLCHCDLPISVPPARTCRRRRCTPCLSRCAPPVADDEVKRGGSDEDDSAPTANSFGEEVRTGGSGCYRSEDDGIWWRGRRRRGSRGVTLVSIVPKYGVVMPRSESLVVE